MVTDAQTGVTAFVVQTVRDVQLAGRTIHAVATETWNQAGQTLTWAVDQAGQAALYLGDQVVQATREAADAFVHKLEAFGGTITQLLDAVSQFGTSAGALLEALVRDPDAFRDNVLGAIKDGFGQFFTELPQNLPAKLLEWLTNGAGAGLPKPLPTSLEAAQLAPWLLDFFRLNRDGILGMLGNVVGAGNVALLADAYDKIQLAWGATGSTAGVFDQVNALLGDDPDQKLDPQKLARAGVQAIVDMVVREVAHKAPAVIASRLTPGGAVLTTVYNGLTWAKNEIGRATGLVKMATALTDKVVAAANGQPDAKQRLTNEVAGFLNAVLPMGISFVASQLQLSTLPQQVAGAIEKVRAAPLAAVEKALTALVAKAKAALGLDGTNAKEYVGLIGKPLVFQVNGQEHRIWVVNQNGKPVVMRASNAGPLDPDRDLPPGPFQTKLKTDDAALLASAAQVLKDEAAIQAWAAADAKARKDRTPAPPRPPELAALTAHNKTFDADLVRVKNDMVDGRATCLFGQACFAAGTPIRTPDGWRSIEDLRVGDLVLSRSEHDPDTPVEPRAVEECFRRTAPVLHLHLTTGEVIRTSAEHPFFAHGKGWTPAAQLNTGDRLATLTGEWAAVAEVLDTGNWEPVYNVRVAQHHTYFVGQNDWGFSVWAHNISCSYNPANDIASPGPLARARELRNIAIRIRVR